MRITRFLAVRLEIEISTRIKNSPYNPEVKQFVAIRITSLPSKRQQVVAGVTKIVLGATYKNNRDKSATLEFDHADKRNVHKLENEIVN